MATKTRAAHAEKADAQDDCVAFLNKIGRAKKQTDGVSGHVFCPVCKSMHYAKIIPHTDVGVADYYVSIRTSGLPVASVVEVKASGIVFPFARVEDEQWKWLARWQDTMGGPAWFWVQMGIKPVNAHSPFRRRVWLVSYDEFARARDVTEAMLQGHQSALYLTREVPHQRYGDIYKANNLYFDEMLATYELDYAPGGVWYPSDAHPFSIKYNIQWSKTNVGQS